MVPDQPPTHLGKVPWWIVVTCLAVLPRFGEIKQFISREGWERQYNVCTVIKKLLILVEEDRNNTIVLLPNIWTI